MKFNNHFFLSDFKDQVNSMTNQIGLIQLEGAINKRERSCKTLQESAKFQTAKYIVQKRLRDLYKLNYEKSCLEMDLDDEV